MVPRGVSPWFVQVCSRRSREPLLVVLAAHGGGVLGMGAAFQDKSAIIGCHFPLASLPCRARDRLVRVLCVHDRLCRDRRSWAGRGA